MRTITVDYAVLMWMVIILFSMVGYFRGWWKEGLTTGFLTGLVVLLRFPGLAEMIINFLNKLIKLVYIAIKAHSLDIERLAEVAKEITDIPIKLDPTDFRVYLAGLIIMLVLSYLVGRISVNSRVIGPNFLGAILGAIFGLLNGFTVISLVREYAVGRYLPGAAAEGVADVASVALAVEELPSPSIVEGWVPWLLIAIGALLLFAVMATRWGVEWTKVRDLVPPLYKAVPTPKPPPTSATISVQTK
jgi:uncharacterized membrane protein required for colicin V production